MSFEVLAHQGGWDEALLVAGPLLVFAGIVWSAKRRAVKQAESSAPKHEAPTSGSQTSEMPKHEVLASEAPLSEAQKSENDERVG